MASRKGAGSKPEKRAPGISHRYVFKGGHRNLGPAASDTFTVRVPLELSRRGGRKVILTPDGGSAWSPPQTRVGNSMIKAIARAHRWKRMLEGGTYASLTELAAAEKINQSYLCRVLRLTLLSPAILAALLDGRLDPSQQLHQFMMPFPVEWDRQAALLGLLNT